ncbi:hypothetical protein [Bradyrhizobium septentrionale]|uniref:Uncharacterized protein n=1 Tax=Bradyrhizobium septentrionale TaxID=1404411 RepID=A0A974A155_9BRAD|nr:hypothetical protein [Bradyrhizobium septentrionale]UGY13089.1 hypothetical protein HAP48_0031415 [Bradyrhizobium septentrionale]UGY21709.1 hypothetical protein HU675_0027240 [Bradyrhizobium septentrionale]
MSDLRGHSPRRYVVDVSGRRVLVGLTLEETSEFEGLDTSLPQLPDRGEQGASAVEGRWLELYDKHDKAWIKWKADLRAGQQGNSPFFN